MGSPPHLRGKPVLGFIAAIGPRITPAPAGKTTSKDVEYALKEDHPRTCGENTKK